MKLISPGEKGYPNEVCSDCGREAALRANTKCLPVSTYHQGKCEVCGRLFQKVTEPRDFGYPPFNMEVDDMTDEDYSTQCTETIDKIIDKDSYSANGSIPHMKNALILCDIDGVLADCSHRLPYLKKKEYDKFYGANMAEDMTCGISANIASVLITGICEEYQNGTIGEVKLKLLTARPARTRELTRLWLRENYYELFLEFMDLKKNDILCRGDNDWRPAGLVKMDLAIDEIASYEPAFRNNLDVFIIDDDPQVIKYFYENFSNRVGDEIVGMNDSSLSIHGILIGSERLSQALALAPTKSFEQNMSPEE